MAKHDGQQIAVAICNPIIEQQVIVAALNVAIAVVVATHRQVGWVRVLSTASDCVRHNLWLGKSTPHTHTLFLTVCCACLV
jgi:hypothetical protein